MSADIKYKKRGTLRVTLPHRCSNHLVVPAPRQKPDRVVQQGVLRTVVLGVVFCVCVGVQSAGDNVKLKFLMWEPKRNDVKKTLAMIVVIGRSCSWTTGGPAETEWVSAAVPDLTMGFRSVWSTCARQLNDDVKKQIRMSVFVTV